MIPACFFYPIYLLCLFSLVFPFHFVSFIRLFIFILCIFLFPARENHYLAAACNGGAGTGYVSEFMKCISSLLSSIHCVFTAFRELFLFKEASQSGKEKFIAGTFSWQDRNVYYWNASCSRQKKRLCLCWEVNTLRND